MAIYIEEIKELMLRCNIEVPHTFREGNKLADHLTNYALNVGSLECNGYNELDVQGRRLINSDKLQCPYLRIKATRS